MQCPAPAEHAEQPCEPRVVVGRGGGLMSLTSSNGWGTTHRELPGVIRDEFFLRYRIDERFGRRGRGYETARLKPNSPPGTKFWSSLHVSHHLHFLRPARLQLYRIRCLDCPAPTRAIEDKGALNQRCAGWGLGRASRLWCGWHGCDYGGVFQGLFRGWQIAVFAVLSAENTHFDRSSISFCDARFAVLIQHEFGSTFEGGYRRRRIRGNRRRQSAG